MSAPYHYGCHYSNSGTVLHFLVRLPPFTKMFLQYQGTYACARLKRKIPKFTAFLHCKCFILSYSRDFYNSESKLHTDYFLQTKGHVVFFFFSD